MCACALGIYGAVIYDFETTPSRPTSQARYIPDLLSSAGLANVELQISQDIVGGFALDRGTLILV